MKSNRGCDCRRQAGFAGLKRYFSQKGVSFAPDYPDATAPSAPAKIHDGEPASLLVPLAALKEGDRAVVADLKCPDGFNCRLVGLGILPGTPFRVLRAGVGGAPMLFEFGNTRVGLSRAVCMMILARVAAEGGAVRGDVPGEREIDFADDCEAESCA